MDEPFEVDRQTELIRKHIMEDMKGKWSECDDCWDWNPSICGSNCPSYRGSEQSTKVEEK